MSQAGDGGLLPPGRPSYPNFRDPLPLLAAEQRTVAWHLTSLARLSDHLVPVAGGGAGPWEPAWTHPELDINQSHATIAGPDGPAPPPPWWDEPADPRAEAAATTRAARRDIVAHRLLDGIGDDPWSLMELQRRLLAPYIFGVADYRLRVAWADDQGDPEVARRGPLVVHEQRSWSTLLTPVYVQLLEGLRRVSEGQRGGAFCRECGLPFLTLDARRALFCNDRERYRHGQRQRRVRMGLSAGRRGDPAS